MGSVHKIAHNLLLILLDGKRLEILWNGKDNGFR